MRYGLRSQKGFTLVEVMISFSFLTVTLLSFYAILISNAYMTSYNRHKLQAAFAAQRILEEQRRATFANLVSANLGAVSVDTKGTFNTTADDLMGAAVLTVTNLDIYRKRAQVEVNWPERSALGAVTMREYYATDIANEPQLN